MPYFVLVEIPGLAMIVSVLGPTQSIRLSSMPIQGFFPQLPVAATIDLQGRLPPPQQIIYTPTILITGILLVIGLIVVIYMSRRAKAIAKREARRDALKIAERIILKRGGTLEDADKMHLIFTTHPELDPAALIIVRDRFANELRPILEKTYDKRFYDRMEALYFPPAKDTRRSYMTQTRDNAVVVEEQKTMASAQTLAAIQDLMDATLKPGTVARLGFEGLEGGYECIVMGHDANAISVTLPANNDSLVASLRPGMRIEGTLESGPSLLAFTSAVVQAVAGSMPYCRIQPWRTAWEVRKREAVRLPISLEIDFQHISTAKTDNIRMSNLSKEIGAIRPGRLIDLSLGGCCIETPSSGVFRVGDMIRFSKSLVTGNPPATLLGAIVKVSDIDPEKNDGSTQRIHTQFLVIDDVSQRIMVRALRQLQDVVERNEWLKAQQLMQQMRRNKIKDIGSPSPSVYAHRDTTNVLSTDRRGSKTTRPGVGKDTGKIARPSTRSITKPPTRTIPRPPTRGFPPKD